MAEQLALPLPARAALGRQDFLVAAPNAAALATVEDWRNWPARKLVLVGPEGAGKTHLAHVWAAEAEARILSVGEIARLLQHPLAEGARFVIDDADRALTSETELQLFGLHNLLQETGGWLMVTARVPVADWPLHLPDLKSRMQAAAVARLDPPDDTLLAGVLLKLFADRQLQVAPDVLGYMAARIERSFAAARDAVAAIDRAALAEKRAVTRPFVAETFGRIW